MLDPTPPSLISALNSLSRLCHEASYRAGWWNCPDTGIPLTEGLSSLADLTIATKFALIHSEVSEAMEGYRTDAQDEKLPKRKAVEVELADVLVRVFDLAGALKLDLGGALFEKMAYNAQRADHKGEARRAKGGKRF